MTMGQDQQAAAAEIVTPTTSQIDILFAKPVDARRPTGEVIAIIAAGGTFLCSEKTEGPKTPVRYENFLDFVTANKLTGTFREYGLYEENGAYYLKDGTQVIYKPLDPAIDSTNATFQDRLRIINSIEDVRGEYSKVNGCLVIHGTDTCAETAQFLDLQYGRGVGFSIGLVSSQATADAADSDGPSNFRTAFKAVHRKLLQQVFVMSSRGRKIFSALVAKFSDSSEEIYTGNLIAECDLGTIRLKEVAPVLPANADLLITEETCFAQSNLYHYNPKADGNQPSQAKNAARHVRDTLDGRDEDPYNGVVVYMAGSGNLPKHAEQVLLAAGNTLPIFAVSEVPGAESLDESGIPKYAVSALKTADELNLNNLIVLPATRPGPDLRPSLIMARAARYATPRTPEFLLFCHLFASFAWTPEDESGKSHQIKGDRNALADVVERLERLRARHEYTVESHADLTHIIMADGQMRGLFQRYIPHIVHPSDGHCMVREGKLVFSSQAIRPEPASNPTTGPRPAAGS